VDIRVNAAAVLEREVARKKPGRVFISSVCDAWQPVEARLGLTRRCLELLRHHRFPVTILTKSALAGRDLDVLHGSTEVEFGVTITTLDEELRSIFEPWASSSSSRLSLLEAARRRGLRTYAFLGPLLPGIEDTEEAISRLVAAVVEAGVSYFYVDRLNLRHRVWSTLSPALKQHFPGLLPAVRCALFQPEASSLYSQRLRRRTLAVARRLGVQDRLRFCF
jgi:DNA repair photolyase